ncbi:hypothetical protein J6590_049603 [Homalodisca vitripennis]|nr:hypothetical protein J6590_049603 [Homalodisca vitripennis]
MVTMRGVFMLADRKSGPKMEQSTKVSENDSFQNSTDEKNVWKLTKVGVARICAKLLIGAPEAQTTQPGVKRGGAVFRCDINTDDHCQEIPFDRTEKERKSDPCGTPRRSIREELTYNCPSFLPNPIRVQRNGGTLFTLRCLSLRPDQSLQTLYNRPDKVSGARAKKPSLTLNLGTNGLKVTSKPPPMAGQAGCLQGQDRSAVNHPSSSHARHNWQAASYQDWLFMCIGRPTSVQFLLRHVLLPPFVRAILIVREPDVQPLIVGYRCSLARYLPALCTQLTFHLAPPSCGHFLFRDACAFSSHGNSNRGQPNVQPLIVGYRCSLARYLPALCTQLAFHLAPPSCGHFLSVVPGAFSSHTNSNRGEPNVQPLIVGYRCSLARYLHALCMQLAFHLAPPSCGHFLFRGAWCFFISYQF